VLQRGEEERAMQRTALKPAWAVAAVLVCVPAPALAQDPGQAQTAAAKNFRKPFKLLELGAYYGAPERLAGSISGVFFYGEINPKNPNTPKKALTLRAAAGQGGVSVAIGHRAPRYFSFGPEALMTVTRTFSSPRGGTGQSTYVGVEVGYVTLGRASIGVARQVDGPSDRRDTILTFSVGVQFPYGFWRW
jgi:hypothetical protein